MNKTIMLGAIPASLALAACGETASEGEVPAETTAIEDDNDAPEPVAEEDHAEEEPHDESVPHDH